MKNISLVVLLIFLSTNLMGVLTPSGGGNGIPYVTPTNNDCLVGNGVAWLAGSCSTGSGTVTSVGLTLPSSILTVSGSPVTGSGTLSATLANALNTANGLVQLNGSGYLPALNASLLINFPTFNQNTSGTAANITASSNSTLTTLSALSLPGSQVTGNIGGNANNVTAISNSTLITLSALSLSGSQVTGSVPGNIAAVTPSTSGNILTSNGSSWVSAAPAGTYTQYSTSTTNNTATVLATIPLAASAAYTCKAIISGYRTDSTDYAHFEVDGSVHSNSGFTCAFEDSTILYQKTTDVSFTVGWSCSTTNTILTVTGNTGKSIDWKGLVICESAS